MGLFAELSVTFLQIELPWAQLGLISEEVAVDTAVKVSPPRHHAAMVAWLQSPSTGGVCGLDPSPGRLFVMAPHLLILFLSLCVYPTAYITSRLRTIWVPKDKVIINKSSLIWGYSLHSQGPGDLGQAKASSMVF